MRGEGGGGRKEGREGWEEGEGRWEGWEEGGGKVGKGEGWWRQKKHIC